MGKLLGLAKRRSYKADMTAVSMLHGNIMLHCTLQGPGQEDQW
jgi:hypothetical protein